jgi:hypothetical protein
MRHRVRSSGSKSAIRLLLERKLRTERICPANTASTSPMHAHNYNPAKSDVVYHIAIEQPWLKCNKWPIQCQGLADDAPRIKIDALLRTKVAVA